MGDISGVFFGWAMRPATVAERVDEDCYKCGQAIEYMVEPQAVGLCATCAQSDIAVHLGAHATPRGSGYLPEWLTPKQYEQIADMPIPPACIRFRDFVSARLDTPDPTSRRQRIIIEYIVPEDAPL